MDQSIWEVTDEMVRNPDRFREIRPFRGKIDQAWIPERERTPVRCGYDRTMQGSGQYETCGSDGIDELFDVLLARWDVRTQDNIALCLEEQLAIHPPIVEVRDTHGLAENVVLPARFVQRWQEECWITLGDVGVQAQIPRRYRSAHRQDFDEFTMGRAQSSMLTNSASPGNQTFALALVGCAGVASLRNRRSVATSAGTKLSCKTLPIIRISTERRGVSRNR